MGTASETPEPAELTSLPDVEKAMQRLLTCTLRHERLTAERDQEIARICAHRNPAIATALAARIDLEWQIEKFTRNHPEAMSPGLRSVQLAGGVIGTRVGAGALALLDDTWSWEKAVAKAKELWNWRYFHPAKPREINKAALKKLTGEQLAEAGLRIDREPVFFYELDRPAATDQAAMMNNAA